MAQFIRGRQAGIQKDFSAEISDDLFVLDDLYRFGVSSRIVEIAYDPIQSLIAVGTARSQFGRAQVYVFGRGRISFAFQLPTERASVRTIQFSADKLLCLDDTNDLSVFSLVDRKLITSYAAPAPVACMASDPTLDFVMLGMQNGDVLAYDLDRQAVVPFRLPCFWSEKNARVRNTPVVSISFHPRDIGTLLIAYVEGACIYSFKQNKPIRFFHYQLPRGAPGGDGDPASAMTDRSPKLMHATWHPTGTFVLTAHEDSSLVFWDAWDGRIVQARSSFDTNVDKPGNNALGAGSFTPRTPIKKMSWCANGSNPDDTGVLVAGGVSALVPSQGMTFMELGRTPIYNTSSYQVLSHHFESPKKQHILPTPPGAEVVNYVLIPRASPWYAGAHDPIAVIAVLSSGELATLSFPSGYPISPSNQLHVSLTLVHPFITQIGCATVERGKWLGLIESRQKGPKFLKGGAEGARPMKRFENRNIVHTAHADGSVRLWDCGHADEIENSSVLQADVGRALGRSDGLRISKVSFSGASSELAVGMQTGEIVVFRWTRNASPGQELRSRAHNDPKVLINVTNRKEPSLAQGLHPFTLLNEDDGPITALSTSDVGFIAAGSKGGSIILIDLRGPAIILRSHTSEMMRKDKKLSFRRQRDEHEANWPTSISFSVMTADEDRYSSIMLHIGTMNGTVATYKILPAQSGGYSAQLAGSIQMEGEIIRLLPLDASSGRPATASPEAVSGLSRGSHVDGVLLAISKNEARIFKPTSSRGASKSWDSGTCESAAVVHCLELGKALLCLFSDATARSFTLPGLSQIGRIKLDTILDRSRLADAVISDAGDILGPTGPSEYALLNVWGTGEALSRQPDLLYNPEATIPPRPTISGLQWVAGVQYITPSDLDILIGGPNRPPSRRMIAQAKADAEAKRQAARPHEAKPSGYPQGSNANDESYWGYVQRQLNERTERLGIMSDSMDRLEDTSSQWVQNVSDYVNQQKKNLIMGAVKHKMGL